MPEIVRRFFVALKRKPQNIPIVAVVICFVWYSFNLSLISFTTTRLQATNMGLTGFVIMLLSVLAIVCCMNAFPYRKKVNIAMLVLLYIMLAVMIVCDLYYLSCITNKLNANVIGEVRLKAETLAGWRFGNLNIAMLLLIVLWGIIGIYIVSSVIRSSGKNEIGSTVMICIEILIILALCVAAFRISGIVMEHQEEMLKVRKMDETMQKVLVTERVMQVHLVMTGISALLVATLPVYRKLIRKIDTSIEVAENAEMEAIDISGE